MVCEDDVFPPAFTWINNNPAGRSRAMDSGDCLESFVVKCPPFFVHRSFVPSHSVSERRSQSPAWLASGRHLTNVCLMSNWRKGNGLWPKHSLSWCVLLFAGLQGAWSFGELVKEPVFQATKPVFRRGISEWNCVVDSNCETRWEWFGIFRMNLFIGALPFYWK